MTPDQSAGNGSYKAVFVLGALETQPRIIGYGKNLYRSNWVLFKFKTSECFFHGRLELFYKNIFNFQNGWTDLDAVWTVWKPNLFMNKLDVADAQI